MAAELAAASLAYPFRAGWRRAWLIGVPLALVCPIGVVPLLGYGVAAARAIARGEANRLPEWRISARLLIDGVALLLLLAAVTAPFGIAVWFGSTAIADALPVRDAFLARGYAAVIAAAPLGLAWALVALVVVPTGVGRYAVSGRLPDLVDVRGAAELIRGRFWAWNLAGVPIVTAWAIAVLALCAGVLGGCFAAFYAILVSAHASATLVREAR